MLIGNQFTINSLVNLKICLQEQEASRDNNSPISSLDQTLVNLKICLQEQEASRDNNSPISVKIKTTTDVPYVLRQ